MSLLLDDLIQQNRADTAAYEEFLRKAEALVKRLAAKHPEAGIPAALHGKHEATVIYNNLRRIRAAAAAPAAVAEPDPTADEKRLKLALEIDRTMREQAPAGWKGDQARETPRQFVTRESHYPGWREARAGLNELPLGAEAWQE